MWQVHAMLSINHYWMGHAQIMNPGNILRRTCGRIHIGIVCISDDSIWSTPQTDPRSDTHKNSKAGCEKANHICDLKFDHWSYIYILHVRRAWCDNRIGILVIWCEVRVPPFLRSGHPGLPGVLRHSVQLRTSPQDTSLDLTGMMTSPTQ
jgi:hypothetical protein